MNTRCDCGHIWEDHFHERPYTDAGQCLRQLCNCAEYNTNRLRVSDYRGSLDNVNLGGPTTERKIL